MTEQSKFFRAIKEVRNDNSWRTTTYQRLDGSLFHVSIPISEERKDGHVTGHRYYNDHIEYQMALNMFEVSHD